MKFAIFRHFWSATARFKMDEDSWNCNHALLACRQSNAANFIQISEETEIGLIDPPPYQEKENNGGGVLRYFWFTHQKLKPIMQIPTFRDWKKI